MLNNNFTQWVAFYTLPRNEKNVLPKVEERGYVAYLPLKKELHKWHDRKKWVEVPLIPSYIFVKVMKKDIYYLERIDGICRAISFGSKTNVSVVTQKDIDAMQRLVESGEQLYVDNLASLKKGSQDRVIGGPFENMEGMLISDCEESNFIVRLESISMGVQLQIEKELLQFIE